MFETGINHLLAALFQAAALKGSDRRETPVSARLGAQQKKLNLPILPTTTTGSFPQTVEIQMVCREYKVKKISEVNCIDAIMEYIKKVVKQQELDIGAHVHGEPEVLQIDMVSSRDGLPPCELECALYLHRAFHSFSITNCGVQDTILIHTQMHYPIFNEIVRSVIKMDADFITIETSCSSEKLLSVFREVVTYGAGIGPCMGDIHFRRISFAEEIADSMNKMLVNLNSSGLWVNPDCGLKIHMYTEIRPALTNMASAAKPIHAQITSAMISKETYIEAIMEEISKVIKQQELDIDALVHGEPESCGSRCVNTTIMYGDVSRPKPMAVFCSKMAQRITAWSMKGMVTAPPVMILNRFGTCHQFELAIKKKVDDPGVQPACMDQPRLPL